MTPEAVHTEAEERAQHLSAIQSLAEQLHFPVNEVAALYEIELTDLRRDALITNYLAIFASRRVSEALRSRLPQQAPTLPSPLPAH